MLPLDHTVVGICGERTYNYLKLSSYLRILVEVRPDYLEYLIIIGNSVQPIAILIYTIMININIISLENIYKIIFRKIFY